MKIVSGVQTETYVFKVMFMELPLPYYVIEMLGSQTLADLNDAIQEALEWDNDHLYSFLIKPRPDQIGELRKALDSKHEFDRYLARKKGQGRKAQELIDKRIERDLKHERVEYSRPYELEYYQKSANVAASKLGLGPDEEFEYLFDYGDEHRFNVVLISKGESAPNAGYPRLVESRGEAREQY